MGTLKKLYIFLFVIILGVLVLPQFNLQIGDTQIQYPNIDFSFISPNSTLGNFKKGYGLYDSKLYTASVSIDTDLSAQEQENEFNYLIDVIQTRIDHANLYDVKVYGQKQDSEYFIKLEFPDYYQESEKLATYLISKGQISFMNDPQITENAIIDLSDSDIVGPIKAVFNDIYGSSLEFKFDDSKLLQFYSALQNERGYFLMNVDASFFAVIQNPNYVYNTNLQTSVFAVPFADIKSSVNVAIYNNIVASYFLTEPLDTQILLTETTPLIVKRDFVQDKLSYIGLFMLGSVILIIGAYLIKKGMNKGFKFGLMLTSYIVLVVFFLKIQSAVLSVSTLLGFVLGLIIAIYIIYRLLEADDSDYKKELSNYANLSIVLGLCLFTIFRLNKNIEILLDAVGVIIASIASIFILNLLNFRYILSMDFNINLKLRRK